MSEPIPMILTCPVCGERHIDKGEFAAMIGKILKAYVGGDGLTPEFQKLMAKVSL